jgi:TorA maturation chaperone TorD
METAKACQVLCAFCSRLLYESPSTSWAGQLREQRALLLEEPFSSVAPTAAGELERLLAGAGAGGGAAGGGAESSAVAGGAVAGGCAGGEAGGADAAPAGGGAAGGKDGVSDTFLTAIHQDHTYLFYLVSISHTSPYESVYRTETREMFGPTTLEVREQYREQGLAVSAEGSLPDDHIGLELDFLGRLFARLAQEAEAGDHAAADATEDTIRRFLGEHLLVFAPTYLRNLQERARTPWYRATGALTQAVIDLLARQMDAQATDAPVGGAPAD